MRKGMVLEGLMAALGFAIGSAGCDGSNSGGPTGGGAQVSGAAREARDAALAEIGKHWIKGTDGWTTARDSGSSFAPIEFLRQFKELTVEIVEPMDLGEADKMNGFEWAGEVTFKRGPAREAGEPGLAFDGLAGLNINRQRGQWTQWVEFLPESMRVQKVKGQWQVHQDTALLRGKIPGPADFAKAGVK